MSRVAFLIVGLIAAGALSWGASDSADADGAAFIDQALLLERYGEPNVAVEHVRGTDDPRGREIMARLFTQTRRYREADSVLALHTPIGDPRALFLHLLWRSRLAVLSGDFEKARSFHAAVESTDVHGLAVYADYIRAESALRLGEFEEAVAWAKRARSRDVPAVIDVPLSEVMLDAYAGLERFEEARTLLEAARGVNRSSEETKRLLMAEFEFYARVGDHDAARSTASRLARRFPRDRSTKLAVDEVLRAIPLADMPNRDILGFVDYFLLIGDVRQARRLLDSTRDRRWSSAQAQERRLLQARIYYATGDYSRAAALARKRYSTRTARRLSTLYLARSYRRSGRRADAARVYEYFARTFPNDRKAAEALFVAAGIYEGSGDAASAERVRAKLRRSYPSSYHGRTVSIQSALRHARSGNVDAAIELLSRRVKRSRGTDEAAMFHLASIQRQAGETDRSDELIEQLRELDPYSFYLFPQIPRGYERPVTTAGGGVELTGDAGLVAFLARADTAKSRATRRIERAIDRTPGAAPAGDFGACLDRAKWFLRCGLRDWAEAELEEARRRCGDSPGATLQLARLYEDWAMPWRSVRLYQRVKDKIHWKVRRDYDDDFRWLLYPTPFPVQVLENAARYDLPPHLVYAMMREESRFDIAAVSRVGALGLMQLMPETGRLVARELEFPEQIDERLLEPEINLAFGVWYAQSLLEKSNGNELRMLAAYNAGPGNAVRWFDRTREEDPRRIVESIDYRETRGYVRRIVESANVYHTLYFTANTRAPSSP